jgi:hypothetical protein
MQLIQKRNFNLTFLLQTSDIQTSVSVLALFFTLYQKGLLIWHN